MSALNAEDIELFYDMMGQDSTQIDAPQEDPERIREVQRANAMEERIALNVAELQKQNSEYRINAKNKTLFRILADNRKTLERRILPLLEMFKVENTYLSQIQNQCEVAVSEKELLGESYRGKIKIQNKECQEYRSQYKPID